MRPVLIIVTTLVLASYSSSAQTDALSSQQQQIVAIASFTAVGDLNGLENSLETGLNSGLSVNEIKEVIVHLYAYCGFPRSIRGLQTVIALLEKRKAAGIIDQWGPEASAINDERSKYDRGKSVLEELVGTPLNGPQKGYAEFSPEIEVFLKEHLFADLFERDVLTYAERELVTISVIASLGNLEPMLRGHLNICLNLGLTERQLEEAFTIVGKSTSGKKGSEAKSILNEITER